MKLSNICCVSTWMGDRLSASCIGSMHEPCVGLQYFRLRPVCLRLIPFSSIFSFQKIIFNKATCPRSTHRAGHISLCGIFYRTQIQAIIFRKFRFIQILWDTNKKLWDTIFYVQILQQLDLQEMGRPLFQCIVQQGGFLWGQQLSHWVENVHIFDNF